MQSDTNWVTLLATNDRRGGVTATRAEAARRAALEGDAGGRDPFQPGAARRRGLRHLPRRPALRLRRRQRPGAMAPSGRGRAPLHAVHLRRPDPGRVQTTARCARSIAPRGIAGGRSTAWAKSGHRRRSMTMASISGSTGGELVAVERATGRLRWRRQLDAPPGSTAVCDRSAICSSAAATAGSRAVESAIRERRLDLPHRRRRGRVAGGRRRPGAGRLGGLLLLRDRRESGKVRWKFETGLGIYLVCRGRGAARCSSAGKDGYLYALSAADGREIWKSQFDARDHRAAAGRRTGSSAFRPSTAPPRHSRAAPARSSGAPASAARSAPRRS